MEFDAESGLDVGEGWLLVKQQGEAGTLSQMGAGGAAADEVACLLEELGREVGAVEG
jgi:hypothetical protein